VSEPEDPNVLHTTSEMTREERAERVEAFRQTAETKTPQEPPK